MSDSAVRRRGRRGSPESWSIDSHVGQRLRIRRTLLGMSQEKLGDAIGLTFQQVQKYERGSNRISAGTLFRLSQILEVPVSFFFDGLPSEVAESRSETASPFDGDQLQNVVSRRDARLLRLWQSAPDPIADEILSLLSALSPQVVSEDASPTGGRLVPSEPTSPAPALSRDARSQEASSPSPRRARRRHGAVWDPADIYSSAQARK